MKTSLLATAILTAMLPAYAFAGAKEDVAAAAKKLTEAEGYTWVTTTESAAPAGGGGGGGGNQFRPGPVEGKTLKSGISLITTKRGDNTTETYVKDGKSVVKYEGAWKTPQEIAAARSADGGGNGGGRGGRGGFGGAGMRNVKSPAEQAAETASKVEKLEEKDGAITGALSAEAVKGMLTFGGGGARRGGGNGGGGTDRPAPPEPKDTSGTVSFWLKDGAIAKVETHVKGTISFGGEDRQIDRKTTTEFSAVGSTKLEVPEEVTKKLAEAKAPE